MDARIERKSVVDHAARGRPRLGPATRALYGLGSLAFGIKDNGFSVLLLIYYNQVMGLPAQLVGAVAMVALFLDAFIDPVIGSVSDRWRSRWGRRHPFMYAAAVPAAVTYLLIWNAPSGWSHTALAAYLTVSIVIVRSFVALYEIPSSALVAELTDDYDTRTSLMGLRIFFAWVGGIGMAFLAFVVFLRPDAAHQVGQLNPDGYARYGLAASVLMALAILASTAGTHRQIPWLRQPPQGAARTLGEVRQALSNRAFLTLMGAGVCGAMAGGLQITLSTYFNTYFWELSAAQVSVLMLGGLIAAAAGVVVANALSRRYGKKRTAMALQVLSIAVAIAPATLRLIGWFPPNGAPALLPILFVSITVSLTLIVSSTILTASMLADVNEDSELSTGKRSEGLFFAANSFVLKCVSGVGIFASGLILAMANFPQDAAPGHVGEDVLRNLALLALPAETVLYLASVAFLAAFPITRAAHEATLATLASRRSEASH